MYSFFHQFHTPEKRFHNRPHNTGAGHPAAAILCITWLLTSDPKHWELKKILDIS
jgi:hypothetical protein